MDLLDLDGEASMDDMTNAARKLKGKAFGSRHNYSYNGRDPAAGGLISEDMFDATRFAKAFPDVPCLDFYAGGEIGGMAKAGRESKSYRIGTNKIFEELV